MPIGGVLQSSVSAATTARIYASPAQLSIGNGGNVSVPVRIDPGSSTIDAVNITVQFPSDQLAFRNVAQAGSTFDTFVPSTSHATSGSVTFGAASLGKTVSGDSLVATLVFTAKASSGTATVDLSGSQAARAGVVVPVATANATISFHANGTASSSVAITNVTVSDVTVNGGTIRWKTNVAATSNVVYGPSAQYGLSAGSDAFVTEHVVKLAPVFGGTTTVHFQITSSDGSDNMGSTGDKIFRTRGYTIAIKVTDKSGKVLTGARVSVDNAAAVKTDNSGVAKVTNVGSGNQKVVVNSGKPQFITVKTVNGAKASDVQEFTLVAKPASLLFRILMELLVAVVAVSIISWLLHKRAHKKLPDPTDIS